MPEKPQLFLPVSCNKTKRPPLLHQRLLRLKLHAGVPTGANRSTFGVDFAILPHMTLRHFIFFLAWMVVGTAAKAQVQMPDGRYRCLTTVIDGDTIPLINMAPVEIIAPLSPQAAARVKVYLKLRRDVLKAYPYARLAATQLKYINDSVARIPNERDRKRFIKATEKQLKADFEKDLKLLTATQGRILIKLIDRETGNTSYALVKELRGSLQAFFWQGLARLFGENLKDDYEADGEDQLIEQIVRQIETGQLTVQQITPSH